MSYDRKVKFSVTGTYGNGPSDEEDVYTIKEFKEYCDAGAFIDYDGWGYPVKDSMADRDICIQPSVLHRIPRSATHIVWYNK